MKTKQYTEGKAQKCEYLGAKFDSKLEMKWAMMFELLGFSWEREPLTFVNPMDRTLTWIPDFKITHKETGAMYLVEVKPNGAFFNIEKTKIARIRQWDCIIVTNSPQDTTGLVRVFGKMDLSEFYPENFLQLWEAVAFI
jgi:hypothetical protein